MKYILDSNTLIYASQPEARFADCRHWIEQDGVAISAISRVEVLGFHGLTQADAEFLATALRFIPQLPVSDAVLDQAVKIRQQFRLKTPDAIVAATALEHGLNLVTADQGFRRVAGLIVIDPLAS
ncbi:type II toxin-antitoxin system VapC family toxin [uncultured Hymenobacter sp.]|uniref:type II toxin-antitoxin system VapC family toxin n=1 Tax=uncultured Hymenobacter sp. TaxID=170016 RepID=UPI0035CB91A2